MDWSPAIGRLVQLFNAAKFGEVLALTGSLLAKAPLVAELHLIRALALSRVRGSEAALNGYRRALIADPGNYLSYYNLANCLRALGDVHGAKRNYRRTNAVEGGFSEAFNNLGLLYRQDRDFENGYRSFRSAIARNPRNPDYLGNAAQLLLEHGRTVEAIEACRKALMLAPGSAAALGTLGLAADILERYPDAIRHNARALVVAPESTVVRNNDALVQLRLGRFKSGWSAYRTRRRPRIEVFNPDGSAVPEWQGGSFRGQRLLLWCEQGIGDQVMFLTLVPHLLRQGAVLSLVVEDRLTDLVRRSFPSLHVIREPAILDEPTLRSPVDGWLFLGDLPQHLSLFCGGSISPETWIEVDRPRAEALRRSLRARHPGKHLVGITWRSIAPSGGDLRTIAPSLWRPVLQTAGCTFVSLQYGATADDAETFRREVGCAPDIDHGIEPLVDLDGLATLVDAVDLVVCPVNNTVHFAGAMGKPCWTLLPTRADWRWGLGSTHSRWYPSVSLYRQEVAGDWRPVMKAVARDLAASARFSDPGLGFIRAAE